MRVTIDLDTKDFRELRRALKAGFDLGLGVPEVIRKSSGGRGYHIIWQAKRLSFDEALAFRIMIGDDERRIFFDLFTEPKQVLFRKKRRR